MDRNECPSFSLLSAHHDGELSKQENVVVESHLRGCAGCRAQVAELRELSQAFRSPRIAIQPIDVVGQVRRGIAEKTASAPRQRSGIGLVPIALAASIVLGLGVTLGSRLASPLHPSDLSTAARLAPFGAVPPGNICLDYPTCYSR